MRLQFYIMNRFSLGFTLRSDCIKVDLTWVGFTFEVGFKCADCNETHWPSEEWLPSAEEQFERWD